MFYRKLFMLFLCLIFVGQNFAQVQPQTVEKKAEISAELKEKAVELITNLARETDQFYMPENRIEARGLVAELLWEHDEKLARQLFQGAISELEPLIEELLAQTTKEEESENYLDNYYIGKLRTDLLMRIAANDPEFALETLRLLTRKKADGKDLFEYDESLEINLASQISQNDPQKAYDLALKNLEQALDYNIYTALEDIYKKDEELGAKFAGDILAKIKKNETKPNTEAEEAARNTTNPTYRPISSENKNYVITFWEVKSFVDKVKELNRQSVKNKKKPVLSEDEYKELIKALGERVVVQSYLSAYQVSDVMKDLEKFDTPTAQAIRRKLAKEKDQLDKMINSDVFKNEIADRSLEEIIAIIEKKPVAQREDLYREAAETIYYKGDISLAKELYAKVRKKPEYDYLGTQIEESLPLSLAEEGNIEESRKMLAKTKTPEERIELLTSLALSLAAKGDTKTAQSFLDEARSMYAGRMKNRRNLGSILQLSQAFAVLEPEQSFSFVENNISFINEVIAAGILIDEFNETGSIKSDEVRLGVVQSESYRDLTKGVVLIKNLATADFERTVGLADKFNRREVRFIARYRIAEVSA